MESFLGPFNPIDIAVTIAERGGGGANPGSMTLDLASPTSPLQDHAERRDYSCEWRTAARTCVNPRIRSPGDRHRGELADVYAQIAKTSIGVTGAPATRVFTPHKTETCSSTDLTPRGVRVLTRPPLDAIAVTASLPDCRANPDQAR